MCMSMCVWCAVYSVSVCMCFQELCLVYRLVQVLLQKIGVEIELGFVLAMSRLLSNRKKRSTEVHKVDMLIDSVQ